MRLEKDLNKLTSLDEHGSRLFIIPAEVKGFFRKRRSWFHLLLLGVFLISPWISFKGSQLVLFNIPERKFILFGVIFRAHDAPLLLYVLLAFTLGLAFVTAIWGRVWCGWACPQTVFIDAVFRRIERWTEGNYLERRNLQLSPVSPKKIRKKTLKWFSFIIVSSLIAHSFIAYFVGANELIGMMQKPPAQNWNYFFLVFIVTALILFDFAWFREQFCVIMCPYGRIQSVLLESSSLAVVYNQERGEPRRGKEDHSKKGDCVSCNRCVEVCPTGIDIRNGLQMECIACTACIDACDEIMEKIKKPKSLISYRTLDGSKFRLMKLKTVFYGALIALSTIAFVFTLVTRKPLEISVLRAIDAPFVVSRDNQGKKQITNHFRLHMSNQSRFDSKYMIKIKDSEADKNISLVVAENPIQIRANQLLTWHVFINAAPELFINGRASVRLIIEDEQNHFERELILLGPQNAI